MNLYDVVARADRMPATEASQIDARGLACPGWLPQGPSAFPCLLDPAFESAIVKP